MPRRAGGGTMSEILGLAFLLAARGRDSGLDDGEILFIVENQLQHLDFIEALKRMGV